MKKYINKLLQFDRGHFNDSDFLNGFLLGYSSDWLLIQVVNLDVSFDGYSIIRGDTLDRYRILNDNGHMVRRALKATGQTPSSPGEVDLSDTVSILKSVNELSPLFSVYRESQKKDSFYLGAISKFTDRTVTLETIDPDAQYGGKTTLRLADITRIDFGTHYA